VERPSTREVERTVTLLRDRYVSGELTLDELSQRVGDVYRAATPEELERSLAGVSAAEPALAERLAPHLLHGEQVLWAGAPDPAKHLGPEDKFLIPFALVWGAGMASAVVTAASLFFIPFVFIALYLLVGRFVVKARTKRRTFYVVTDRRVFAFIRRRAGDELDALFLDTIPAVHRRVRRDGSGSVSFGTRPMWMFANNGLDFFGTAQNGGSLGFYDIPDANHVADLVTRLRNEEARPRSS
jgi:hypothetical protein